MPVFIAHISVNLQDFPTEELNRVWTDLGKTIKHDAMPEIHRKDIAESSVWAETFRNWLMAALSLVFVVLYAAALLGWLRPVSDLTMISRLEPIIFVIIGFYFGRLPSQQNEKTLREEIVRQTKNADGAYLFKEQADKEREAIEEKIKNAKVVLEREIANRRKDIGDHRSSRVPAPSADGGEPLNRSLELVKRILDV